MNYELRCDVKVLLFKLPYLSWTSGLPGGMIEVSKSGAWLGTMPWKECSVAPIREMLCSSSNIFECLPASI